MGSTYLVENQEIPQGDVKIPSLKKTKQTTTKKTQMDSLHPLLLTSKTGK